jgi:DNA-binding PadR family transcriptional regulator
MHGYQIIQEIGERTGGAWQPSPGAVYPALQLLEDQGLIRAEETEGRRVYHLTDSGRSLVEERREELTGLWEAVNRSADEGTTELRDLYGQLGAAVRQVAHEGTPTEIAEARKLLIAARKQLYRILAGTQDHTDDE